MYSIDAYKIRHNPANISSLPVKREWMDETWEAHAYKCFPVTLTNSFGWGLSFPEDITFIWDGISDSSDSHVKILSGNQYVYTNRANATISFNTGWNFKTKENISLLQMPVPNQFIEGAIPFTTIISTSFFRGEFPCAWRVIVPNKEITIKANTPVISIIPVSLGEINNSEINLKQSSAAPENYFLDKNYVIEMENLNQEGKWSNFYRDARDHLGNQLGQHETKSIKLKVNEI